MSRTFHVALLVVAIPVGAALLTVASLVLGVCAALTFATQLYELTH